MGSLGDKRGKFKDLQIAATKYKFPHFKKENSSQDEVSLTYQLSLNLKYANQMERMECTEKICSVRNWKHISKRIQGAKMLNLSPFMKTANYHEYNVGGNTKF